MSDRPAPPLIDDAAQLQRLVERLRTASPLPLDTEFVRESTYHARLCLVQVCVDGEPACVDPLAEVDLAPFWDAVLAPAPVALMHSARQDLELVQLTTGRLPATLFDTQVAAGLVGMPPQIGYGGLVEALLGIRLEKGHTRTDWSRRPLSAQQLAYAADDVRHLLPAHERLQERLRQLGRVAWAEEDSAALLDPNLYSNPPEDAWQRVKGLRRLDPAGRRIAAALAAWRERTAERLNRPRQWILADALLLAIAAARPDHLEALQRITDMPAGLARRRGDDIVELVRGADRPSPVDADDSGPLDELEKARLERLLKATRSVAKSLELDPQLLATRAELTRIARTGSDEAAGGRVFRGWRDETVGVELRHAL